MSIRIALTIIGLAASLGCGGSSNAITASDNDTRDIGLLIADVNEVRTDPKTLPRLFANDSAPSREDMKRFAKLSVSEGSKTQIEGETATADVVIRDESTNTNVASVKWSFVKEAGKWKIKAAPLQ